MTTLKRFHHSALTVCILSIAMALGVAASAAAEQRLSVSVDIANIRSGPGTNHDLLWKVEKYHPLQIIKKSGSWYQFRDYEGDEGWIFANLVDATPTVIVKKENVNIRSGPGTDNDILFQAEKGVTFKVLEEKGNWIHIAHADGDKGWIYKPLVW